MTSLKTAFGRASRGPSGVCTFWMLVWAIAILDDAEAREKKKRRKKRERTAKPKRKNRKSPDDTPRPS